MRTMKKYTNKKRIEDSQIEVILVRCPECRQEAPIFDGRYDLIHDKECSGNRIPYALSTKNSGKAMYQIGKKEGRKELLKEVINELESNPNLDGSTSPNLQHWIEAKQAQLLSKLQKE